jgi:hypothetical protein
MQDNPSLPSSVLQITIFGLINVRLEFHKDQERICKHALLWLTSVVENEKMSK